jgi:hypothetical protein
VRTRRISNGRALPWAAEVEASGGVASVDGMRNNRRK